MIDYLEQGRILCRRIEAATSGNRKKEARKTDLRWSALLNNATAHTSQVTMTAANEYGFENLPHPPYFPDMAPSDFCLFPKLKSHPRGTHYGSNEGVIEAVNKYLGDQEKAFYFEGIRMLQQRWAKCIALKGYYIEK